jgi:beta-glucosidase
MLMSKILPTLLALCLCVVAMYAYAAPPAPATAPVDPREPEPADASLIPVTPRTGWFAHDPPAWRGWHESLVRRAAEGNCDLLFLGDSITQHWSDVPELFAERFGPYRPLNLGIGGDATQQLLWRIDHGALDGLSPQLVVLMIGTNNLWNGKVPPAAIGAGVDAVLAKVHAKLPKAQILLLGVPPNQRRVDNGMRQRVRDVNVHVARLAERPGVVRYLDITDALCEPDGTLSEQVSADQVHLTSEGYRRWAAIMGPVIEELLAHP